jgi:hypothetical protein
MVDVEQDESIEFEDAHSDENQESLVSSEGKGKRKVGATKAEPSLKKIRLTLEEAEDGPLHQLQAQLRDRGIKNPDLGDVVSAALATISEAWWAEKVEELTPLEWKLQAALENPELREKLVSLLETNAK